MSSPSQQTRLKRNWPRCLTARDDTETTQDLTILVVDDDPVGVNVLERTRHKEVCQVITADDDPPVRRLASSQEVYMVE